jgi:hypothetical protein
MTEPKYSAEVFARLAAAMSDAANRHNETKNAAIRALSAETSALNDLNTAQKAFDEAVAALKKAAPPGSDWGTAKRTAGKAI